MRLMMPAYSAYAVIIMKYYSYEYGIYRIMSQYMLSNVPQKTDGGCTDTKKTLKIKKYNSQIYNRSIVYSDDSIQYCFDFDKRCIYVNNYSQDSFNETVYSLPLTLFFVYEGYVPLHCSAVEKKGDIFLFMADKGKGKSTLALYLSEYMNVFTDDQLFVSGIDDKSFFKISNTMKLTRQSFIYIGKDDEYDCYKNEFYDKAIINTDEKINRFPIKKELKIKKCFFLERHREDCFKSEPIAKGITAKSNIFKNISYKKYLTQEDFTRIAKSPFWNTYAQIEYNRLYVPDIINYPKRIDTLIDILNQ